jgi:LysM repeat protein
MKRVGFLVAAVLLLSLVAVIPAAAQPATAGACGATYTVTWGDTLNKIAAKCGVSLAALRQANPHITNPNKIFAGQKLNIPGGNTTPPPAQGTTYYVRYGDTLARIAARFGTSVSAILAANPNIKNPNRIFAGMRITIPGKSSPPTFTEVKIALIALEGGNIGCGDGVVLVRRNVPATTAPLTAAIRDLLSIKDQYYGQSGLYNALYQSNLAIQSVAINSGKATIKLTGQVVLGGVCDAPRVQAQFEHTGRQFSTVQSVEVFVNDVPLVDVLSSK